MTLIVQSPVQLNERFTVLYYFDDSDFEIRLKSDDMALRKLYFEARQVPRMPRYVDLAFAGGVPINEALCSELLTVAEDIRNELSSGDDDPAIDAVIQDELRAILKKNQTREEFRKLQKLRLATGFARHGFRLFQDDEAVELLNISKEAFRKLSTFNSRSFP